MVVLEPRCNSSTESGAQTNRASGASGRRRIVGAFNIEHRPKELMYCVVSQSGCEMIFISEGCHLDRARRVRCFA